MKKYLGNKHKPMTFTKCSRNQFEEKVIRKYGVKITCYHLTVDHTKYFYGNELIGVYEDYKGGWNGWYYA